MTAQQDRTVQDDRTEDAAQIGASVADRSLRIATALSAELVVLRERLEIVERLAAERGLFGPEEIDAYRPAPAVAAGFKAKRQAFVQRVFGAMRG